MAIAAGGIFLKTGKLKTYHICIFPPIIFLLASFLMLPNLLHVAGLLCLLMPLASGGARKDAGAAIDPQWCLSFHLHVPFWNRTFLLPLLSAQTLRTLHSPLLSCIMLTFGGNIGQ